MKFLRIEVENWRPFWGSSEMDLAVSADRPITLVFGKNGGGKTSLLTAIYWCLHGEMNLEEGKGKQHLVNDYAVKEHVATPSDPVRATVTVYASHTTDGTAALYRIERKQLAYEVNSVRTEAKDGLTVDRISPHHSYRPGDDVVAACRHQGANIEHFEGRAAQRIVDNLLPRELAKYFFYPGETLAFPFKDDTKSQKDLKIFLREISGSSKFAPFTALTKSASKKLTEKSNKHAAADKTTKRLQHEIGELSNQLDDLQKQLPRVQDERDAASENRSEIVARLAALDAFEVVLGNAEAARDAQKAAETAVNHAEQSLSDALRDAYLCVADPLFEAVLEVFGKRRYPQDISSALVQQLRESRKCICKRELDDKMLTDLEPLSRTDDSVTNRMIALASHASDPRISTADRAAVDAARDALDEALKHRSSAIQACDSAEARLEAAGAAKFDGIDKDNLVAERSKKDNEIRGFDMKIGGLQRSIEDIEKSIDKKEKEKTDAAPQMHRAAHEAAAIAREIAALLDAISTKQADVAREQLEELIAQNYRIYKSNIRAGVDPEFGVRVYDDTGDRKIEKPVGDLSGSETALLTYAFAAAAAKLLPQYQTLDKLLTTIPEFGEVENIPLVVDAPFASLGPEYKRRVIDLMTVGFSQVIMFTEATDTGVLERVSQHIGGQYLVHFEGNMDDSVETDFEWQGQTYTYASKNSDVVKSSLVRIGGES